ncbi:cell envelope integrity protein TolA [Piscinibacter sp.]|uniref:cell envelope integrity protein TolA n=1 Tax=Piscinibacter sp. TaxID=1903157 RepID=UPI0035596C03
MSTFALQRDALMPHPPSGMGPGLMLALLVHVALVVALAFGVNWHASEREGVEAELWAAVPQIAAPRAVEPEPAPVVPAKPAPVPKSEPTPDAQIAIERAKREEQRKQKEIAEKQEQERLKAQALKLEAQRKKEEETRLASQRDANLKRMMGQAGATGDASSTGTAAQSAGPSAGYAGRIKARIKPNIVFTDNPSGNPVAEVEVRLAPDGRILSQKLLKASGLKEWDDAVQRAIDRTEVLPRDLDGRVPPTIVITFRPHD